jgi:hypothetical protein
MLVVVENGFGHPSQEYFTPTNTGPLEIKDERDEVLILESIAGEYNIYSKPTNENPEVHSIGKIETPGRAVYYFNLRTKQFQ